MLRVDARSIGRTSGKCSFVAKAQQVRFCPKKFDLTGGQTLHPSYNRILVDYDWDQPKTDLRSEMTSHQWALQAIATVYHVVIPGLT